jgi:enamine deaminase RidA (YjgF/YER057c/UK114 family)
MEGIMTQLADASRRDLIAAVASVAAAASAAQDAQAQTPSNLRFFNPTGMSKPTGYSQVVEINGPHRTIYLAGQTGIDANGKLADGFRAQAVQVMENIKTALASVGAGFEHVVKLTSYLTDLEANGAEFREVRNSYFPNKAGLPQAPCCRYRALQIRAIWWKSMSLRRSHGSKDSTAPAEEAAQRRVAYIG